MSEGQTTGEGAFVEHRSEHSVFPRLGGHQEKTVHFGQIEFVGDVTPVHKALAQRVAMLARKRLDTLRFFSVQKALGVVAQCSDFDLFNAEVFGF